MNCIGNKGIVCFCNKVELEEVYTMLHNENSRVKIPALVHFTRLGYEYLSLKNYSGKNLIDEDTNIFIDLLCAAINRINGIEYTLEDTQKLINELKLVLDNEDIGRAFYFILLNGYKGIKLVDFEDSVGEKNRLSCCNRAYI